MFAVYSINFTLLRILNNICYKIVTDTANYIRNWAICKILQTRNFSSHNILRGAITGNFSGVAIVPGRNILGVLKYGQRQCKSKTVSVKSHVSTIKEAYQ